MIRVESRRRRRGVASANRTVNTTTRSIAWPTQFQPSSAICNIQRDQRLSICSQYISAHRNSHPTGTLICIAFHSSVAPLGRLPNSSTGEKIKQNNKNNSGASVSSRIIAVNLSTPFRYRTAGRTPPIPNKIMAAHIPARMAFRWLCQRVRYSSRQATVFGSATPFCSACFCIASDIVGSRSRISNQSSKRPTPYMLVSTEASFFPFSSSK